MSRIADDHFSNLAGAGPKRIREAIVAPESSARPWLWVFGLILVAIGGGAAWLRPWETSQPAVPMVEAVAPAPAVAVVAAPRPIEVISMPEVTVSVASQVPAPAGDPVAIARKRRELTERSNSLGNGVATIERAAAGFRKDLAPLQAEITDADTKHWPKPTGIYTYEGYLAKLRDDARAAGNVHLAYDIEGQWSTYRLNRNKTLTEIARLQGLIDSREKSLAAAKSERAQAQAELVALTAAAP